MQISLPDCVEDTRQRSNEARKQKDSLSAEATQKRIRSKEKELEERSNDQLEIIESVELESEEFSLSKDKSENSLKTRNMMDISGTAITSMRYQLSVRSTAAVITSFLSDLIKAGELSPNKSYLAVDAAKLQRARDKVLAE